MSRGYGIGAKYLAEDMINWHLSGDKNYTFINGVKARLPRYYKEKIWYSVTKKSSDLMSEVKFEHPARNRVREESKWLGIKLQRKALRAYVKKFGRKAKSKMAEHRKAVILGIKVKIAYTQTF